jgi:4'-phosphopantetheinyl transferase
MREGTVTIHLIRQGAAASPDVLTIDERSRAASFRFEADRANWIACRAALRRILATATGLAPENVPLVTNAFGKPMLSPPFEALHFNLSHCDDLAVVAVSLDGPVGIDIEALARAAELEEAMKGFCHPQEIAELPCGPDRSFRLLEIWTAKEALLKALGTGFSTAPEGVRLSFTEDVIIPSSTEKSPDMGELTVQRVVAPRLAAHMAMVCVAGSFRPDISVTEFEPSGGRAAE